MEINWKRNTALFMGGQALTFFGTMIAQYAVFWHVTLKSQSGTMMMLFTLIAFLPMFFISPFAGVWSDRFNRKYIINIADGAGALSSLIVAVLLISGNTSYMVLFICSFVRSLAQGVQTPTVNAFIPQIVPQEHLTRINGIQTSINSFIALMAPMISAALMTFTTLQTLFLVDVATAAAGISIMLSFVKIPAKAKAEIEAAKLKGTAYLDDLKEGLKYIRNHGYILRMITITAFFCFLFSPASFLTPLQVVRNFGDEVWRLSAIEIAFSAGMMLGGIFIGMWPGLKNRVHTMAIACLLCGILCMGLGITPAFWPYMAIMAAVGLVCPYYNATAMVLLQTTVEPAFMGRVLSVFTMVTSFLMPMGMLLFGPLADKVSIDTLLIITGFLVLFLGIPMMTSKTLRAAGVKHLESEPDAPEISAEQAV
ncbi:MAG: MFS transporter [Chitinispirillia bacterium]|nr:MFS transporter [Chitinispirillia bacterium]